MKKLVDNQRAFGYGDKFDSRTMCIYDSESKTELKDSDVVSAVLGHNSKVMMELLTHIKEENLTDDELQLKIIDEYNKQRPHLCINTYELARRQQLYERIEQFNDVEILFTSEGKEVYKKRVLSGMLVNKVVINEHNMFSQLFPGDEDTKTRQISVDLYSQYFTQYGTTFSVDIVSKCFEILIDYCYLNEYPGINILIKYHQQLLLMSEYFGLEQFVTLTGDMLYSPSVTEYMKRALFGQPN